MATKKYVSLSKLSAFLDKLKTTFASISHTHNVGDLTDYVVDSALSDTSANPVQNKVINAEFDSIATAMNALETAIDGKADADHNHDDYETKTDASSKLTEAKSYTDSKLSPITTSGTSTAYTATVNGITELTVGVSFVLLPHVESTSTSPTLDVNGLGAIRIRRRLSTNTTTTSAGASDEWLSAGKPIRVTYDGTFWIADLQKSSATDLMGTVPVQNGGTGVNTEADLKTLITSTAYQIGGDEPASGPIMWFDTTSTIILQESEGVKF